MSRRALAFLRGAVAVSLLPILLCTPRRQARADGTTKRACVHWAEEAQTDRADGYLVRALASARNCGSNTCPVVVRADCRRWQKELEAEIPRWVVRVRDAEGNTVPDARVRLDDNPELESPSSGEQSLEFRNVVDPGAHVVDVEADGFVSTRRQVEVVAGQREVVTDVVLVPLSPAPRASPVVVAAISPAPIVGTPSPTPFRIVLFSVGAMGLATFAIAGIPAYLDLNHLRGTCAPYCSQGDVNGDRARIVAGDIGLGVGVAALGAATWLTLSRATGSGERAKLGGERTLGLVPVRGGAAFGYGGALP